MSDPQQPQSQPEQKPAAEAGKTAEKPAAAAPADKAEDPHANPEAKAARPKAAAATPEQQKAQLVMIFVIVMFAAAGLMMIPGVRNAIFGGDADSVAQQAQPAPGTTSVPPPQKLPEKKQVPRNYHPLGNYTQVLGKMRSFSVDASGFRNIMYYYLYVPPIARQQQGVRLPLVAYLHDEDGMAAGALNLLRLNKHLPAYVLLLMIPKGTTWAVPEKYSGEEFGKGRGAAANAGKWSQKAYPEARQLLKEVIALVSSLTEIYSVDDTRMYVAGCGEGAIGVYGAAAKYGDFFAGGLVVNGLWSFLDAPQMTGMPLLLLHGAKNAQVDPIVAEGMSQLITRGGGKASYYAMPDVNCSDGRAMGATAWKWLFGQKRAPAQLEP